MSRLNTLQEIRDRQTSLAQHTPEWFAARSRAITASEASSFIPKCALTCALYNKAVGISVHIPDPSSFCDYERSTSLRQSVIRKLSPKERSHFMDLNCNWGTRFEGVARQLFQSIFYPQLRGDAAPSITEVHELGLVRHPVHPFVAASPDGVVETADGYLALLEIKCPRRRQQIGWPSLYYWIQIQCQLSCTGLQQAYFLDAKFLELDRMECEAMHDRLQSAKELEEGEIAENRGNLPKYLGAFVRLGPESVELPPQNMCGNWKEQETWCLDRLYELMQRPNTNTPMPFTQYWALMDSECVVVPYEEDWFESCVVPALERAITLVAKLKEEGFEPPVRQETRDRPWTRPKDEFPNVCLC